MILVTGGAGFIGSNFILHWLESTNEAVVNLDKMLYEDAKKEFSMTAQTGFGADGNQKQKKIDFEQVRKSLRIL